MFLGDSITQGGMYVGFLEYALRKNNPNLKYDFFSIGLRSETVSGLSERDHPFPRPCLHERLSRALDIIEPEIVFACYGMNDGIYHPLSQGILDAFQEGMRSLVAKCQEIRAQLVIITPPVFQGYVNPQKLRPQTAEDFSFKAPYENYHETIQALSTLLKSELPVDVICIDLHNKMAKYLDDQRKLDPGFFFSKDSIHPGIEGHLFIAQVILNDLNIDVKALFQDSLKVIKNDELYKFVEQRRQIRSRGWLKYIGYTLGKVYKIDSIEETKRRCSEILDKINNLD